MGNENILNEDYESLAKEILKDENVLDSLNNKDISTNHPELKEIVELGKKANFKELLKHFSRSIVIILLSLLFLNDKTIFLALLLGGLFSDIFFTSFRIYQKEKAIERKKQSKLLELQNELTEEQEKLKNLIEKKKDLLKELESKISGDIIQDEKLAVPLISQNGDKKVDKILSLTRKKDN